MSLLSRLSWVFVVLVFPIVGCVEVTDGSPRTAPLVMALTGVDEEWLEHALEGAELCEADTPNCALSDAKGEVAIEVPAGQEISVTLTKEGYGSYLVPMSIRSMSQESFSLATDGHLKDQFGRVTSPYPMRFTGTVLLFVVPNFAGVTFELADATGKTFYHEEEGPRSLDLTETTSSGGGGFAEVTPGEFQAKLGGTAERCVPGWGWPGEVNSVRFPVRENFITYVTVLCPPPP